MFLQYSCVYLRIYVAHLYRKRSISYCFDFCLTGPLFQSYVRLGQSTNILLGIDILLGIVEVRLSIGQLPFLLTASNYLHHERAFVSLFSAS